MGHSCNRALFALSICCLTTLPRAGLASDTQTIQTQRRPCIAAGQTGSLQLRRSHGHYLGRRQVESTPIRGETRSGGGASGGSADFSLDEPEAILIVAVLALAVTPIIAYTLNDGAPAWVQDRYGRCVESQVRLSGGVFDNVTGPGQGGGLFGVDASIAYGLLGLNLDLEGSPDLGNYRSEGASLRIRLKPKANVELAFGIGWRGYAAGDSYGQALEVSVPHRYLFDKNARNVGLEFVPALVVGSLGIDARVRGNLFVDVGNVLTLNLGGKAFSMGDQVYLGAVGGLSFHF